MSRAIDTVLVVDDDEDVRENLQEIFQQEGYRVLIAQNGLEALDAVKNCHGRCIILLDLLMPEMDGWEFIEAQLELSGAATRPIIIVSGALDAARAARLPGVVSVLMKPFELTTLIELVEDAATPIFRSRSATQKKERPA